MIDVLNLALPYFSLIFIGFACGKAKGLPEAGLAWIVALREPVQHVSTDQLASESDPDLAARHSGG